MGEKTKFIYIRGLNTITRVGIRVRRDTTDNKILKIYIIYVYIN